MKSGLIWICIKSDVYLEMSVCTVRYTSLYIYILVVYELFPKEGLFTHSFVCVCIEQNSGTSTSLCFCCTCNLLHCYDHPLPWTPCMHICQSHLIPLGFCILRRLWDLLTWGKLSYNAAWATWMRSVSNDEQCSINLQTDGAALPS